jgi:hypothetical protein
MPTLIGLQLTNGILQREVFNELNQPRRIGPNKAIKGQQNKITNVDYWRRLNAACSISDDV